MGDVSVTLGNGSVPSCAGTCVQFYGLVLVLPA